MSTELQPAHTPRPPTAVGVERRLGHYALRVLPWLALLIALTDSFESVVRVEYGPALAGRKWWDMHHIQERNYLGRWPGLVGALGNPVTKSAAKSVSRGLHLHPAQHRRQAHVGL